MVSRKLVSASLALAVVLGAASRTFADPFTFGVMSDTQLTGYTVNGVACGGTNGVSTQIISEVNKEFNRLGVNFVVQVGDLTENGGVSQLQTHLDANAGIATYNTPTNTSQAFTTTALNAKFFGLRGNHEGDSTSQTFFQNNYIPTTGGGYTVEVAPFDNTSYAVTYNGVKIVLLDYNTSLSTSLMDQATAWSNTVLSENDHTQAFMFHHKNLVGQNHKDNQFQTGGATTQDANPTQQNAFISMLQSQNVKYDISGHDHMNHRAIITSPDGQSSVQEIIAQSDSTKFYTASSGFLTRDQSISDQQDKIGYYTFTVDGPRVTGQYVAAEKNVAGSGANGTIVDNPVWTIQETFGYSRNGKQFTVARGGDYSAVHDSITSGTVYGETFNFATSMALAGTNTVTGTAEGLRAEVDDVNTGWPPARPDMASNILTLWGMKNALGVDTTDPYTLTLSYKPGTMQPAIEHMNSDGSWSTLGGADNGDGTISVSNLSYVGNFAVVSSPVPEPASMAILALGGVALLVRRRKTV
jgi:hypothetical protein